MVECFLWLTNIGQPVEHSLAICLPALNNPGSYVYYTLYIISGVDTVRVLCGFAGVSGPCRISNI